MQASPISASIHGVSVVIRAGKMGYVYEMNAATGKLIWKTPVGEHNGHDNDSLQALEHKSTLKAPYTLIALNRNTGAIAYQRKLPTSANSPIAIAGHTVIVPAGDPGAKTSKDPQLVAYTAP